jgi:hypothetical protein
MARRIPYAKSKNKFLTDDQINLCRLRLQERFDLTKRVPHTVFEVVDLKPIKITRRAHR